jgi:thioredoxin-dependent peroxiredoxin
MRAATRWVAAAWLLGVSAMLTDPASAADNPKPKVGDPFPDIKLKATQAELVKKGATELSIKDLKGKYVVVAFYPKALTGG